MNKDLYKKLFLIYMHAYIFKNIIFVRKIIYISCTTIASDHLLKSLCLYKET